VTSDAKDAILIGEPRQQATSKFEEVIMRQTVIFEDYCVGDM
jgi:hypothetical protein